MSFLRSIFKIEKNLFHISSLMIGRKSTKAMGQYLTYDFRLFGDQKLMFCKVTSSISVVKRFKYQKTPKNEEPEEEFSDDEDDGESNLIIGHLQSLRLDGLLKSGLGMARNKVETCFYENKIRVNGRKILKKSHKVKVGDEIDIIKGPNPMNETLLNISRVVLVSVKENEDGDKLKVKMKRYKDMTVKDYSEP